LVLVRIEHKKHQETAIEPCLTFIIFSGFFSSVNLC
jgi:hypothetical protein